MAEEEMDFGEDYWGVRMPRTSEEIAADIDKFEPNDGLWLGLEELLEELFQTKSQEIAVPSLFRVFERYPSEDGGGVFWGILHGIESIPGYESHLVKSIQSKPTEFSIIMVHRILNTGVEHVSGIHGQKLLDDVVNNQSIPEDIRKVAQRLLDSQLESS